MEEGIQKKKNAVIWLFTENLNQYIPYLNQHALEDNCPIKER